MLLLSCCSKKCSGGIFFSCFGKKRIKRSRHRGGADRRSLSVLLQSSTSPTSPSSRPPLCTPPGPCRKFVRSRAVRCGLRTKETPLEAHDGGRKGGRGGGRLKVGVQRWKITAVSTGFAVSASPQPLSLVLSCAGTRKYTGTVLAYYWKKHGLRFFIPKAALFT